MHRTQKQVIDIEATKWEFSNPSHLVSFMLTTA